MTITKPSHGATGWDTAVNQLIDVANATFNVKTFGAVGDGVTNDTTAVQAALTAAGNAGGGGVHLPSGTYLISTGLTVPDKVFLIGDGEAATTIQKSGNIDLLQFHGTSTGTHNFFNGAMNLQLYGDGFSGRLIDLVYISEATFINVFCNNNADIALDMVEVWDSKFVAFSVESCGSASATAVWIRTARAASGFGSSTDSTNQIHFYGLRVETYLQNAVRVEVGTGGSDIHSIYLHGLKIESHSINGDSIVINGRNVNITDAFVAAVSFNTGFSTASNLISIAGGTSVNIRNSFFYSGTSGIVSNGVNVANGTVGVLIDNVYGAYGFAPTGAHINLAGGAQAAVENIGTALGTLLSGTPTGGGFYGGRLVLGAALQPASVALTDGATVALDSSLGRKFALSAAGNRTILAPTGSPVSGQEIVIEHTASGGARTLSLTTGSAGSFAFGTTITALSATTSGLTDYITCVYSAGADRWRVVQYVKGY